MLPKFKIQLRPVVFRPPKTTLFHQGVEVFTVGIDLVKHSINVAIIKYICNGLKSSLQVWREIVQCHYFCHAFIIADIPITGIIV